MQGGRLSSHCLKQNARERFRQQGSNHLHSDSSSYLDQQPSSPREHRKYQLRQNGGTKEKGEEDDDHQDLIRLGTCLTAKRSGVFYDKVYRQRR